jgi:stage II sporulation protein P
VKIGLVEQTVSGGTMTAGIAVKNQSGVAADIAAALADGLPFSIEKDTVEPQVLIYHTHATETYMPYAAGYYNSGDTSRVPENPRNVRAVGDALAAELTAAGIAVLHDTTLHDSPQYRGAYDRSAKTVAAILAEYPSIKVVLDIHRDGLMLNSRDKLKPTVTVDSKKAAQVMLVCGVLSTDALPHKEWRQNLRFAAGLQQKLATVSSGFARPLSLVSARYNQHLSVGSLLIEVGSEGNTLDEATYAAQLLGRALAGLLTGDVS